MIAEIKTFINSEEWSNLFQDIYDNKDIPQDKKDEIEATWRA
jgi:hypothetical protein